MPVPAEDGGLDTSGLDETVQNMRDEVRALNQQCDELERERDEALLHLDRISTLMGELATAFADLFQKGLTDVIRGLQDAVNAITKDQQ